MILPSLFILGCRQPEVKTEIFLPDCQETLPINGYGLQRSTVDWYATAFDNFSQFWSKMTPRINCGLRSIDLYFSDPSNHPSALMVNGEAVDHAFDYKTDVISLIVDEEPHLFTVEEQFNEDEKFGHEVCHFQAKSISLTTHEEYLVEEDWISLPNCEPQTYYPESNGETSIEDCKVLNPNSSYEDFMEGDGVHSPYGRRGPYEDWATGCGVVTTEAYYFYLGYDAQYDPYTYSLIGQGKYDDVLNHLLHWADDQESVNFFESRM